jgi:ketosteroid isomerase-like protein
MNVESERLTIERLLTDFAWFADRGDGESLSRLFTTDAALFVSGLELKGREQISADCHRRASNPDRRTRHIWSNLRIDQIGAEVATSFAIQITLEQTGAGQPTQVRINDLIDEFRRDEAGAWKISRRVIDRKMAFSIP